MLFDYPRKAFFGRVLPKNKIYERAHVAKSLKRKFVDQIERITWAYKLAPETVNLTGSIEVPEIEILVIELKGEAFSADLIRCLDNAIPFPVIHEIVAGGKTKVIAAYKRPSEGDSAKWVTDAYFESPWLESGVDRKPLPMSVNLNRLYELLLGALIPLSRRGNETIREIAARAAKLRSLESEAAKIESRLSKEKQFNRRVEINTALRKLRTEIEILKS